MSSSNPSVFEATQSCLLEQRVMMMKLAPPVELGSNTEPETPHDDHSDTKQDKTSDDTGGWNLLQSLYDNTHKPEPEKVYVPPTSKKKSPLPLSAKSLEMCTESLGCETGVDGDDIALFSPESSEKQSEENPATESSRNFVSKRVSRIRRASNFPPPLSSVRERDGVQLRHRREDGRLILEAVPAASPLSYLRAERSDGRLILSLTNNFHSSYEEDDEAVEEEEEEADDDQAEEEGLDENYANAQGAYDGDEAEEEGLHENYANMEEAYDGDEEEEEGLHENYENVEGTYDDDDEAEEEGLYENYTNVGEAYDDAGPSWYNQTEYSYAQMLHLMAAMNCDG